MVSIFKWKGEIWNCSCYRAMKLLEYGMKVVERVLEKSYVVPERRTVDAVFILKMQEECHDYGKSCICVLCT